MLLHDARVGADELFIRLVCVQGVSISFNSRHCYWTILGCSDVFLKRMSSRSQCALSKIRCPLF